MDLHGLSAVELGCLLAGRKISAPEIVQSALERISRFDKQLNAFITLCPENALEEARQIQRQLDNGAALPALAGVPLAVKDNISTRGVRTTCASRMLERYCPPFDATAIERLRAGQAIILGKTNLDEFAMGSTGETSAAGPARNPWALDRVPGGSSSGSAAAVAAGLAWYALGSDTGGSIRQPCAYCGLTGLKPTYGSVSRYGLIAYASSLDQIGPIARTADDCAAVMAMIAGSDPRDSTCRPAAHNLYPNALRTAARAPQNLRGIRIGLPEAYFGAGLADDARLLIQAAASKMAELGAEVESCSLPLVDEAVAAYYLIATAEASANLARYDGIRFGMGPDLSGGDLESFYCRTRTQGFGREVRRRILLGTFALSAGYYDAYYLKALKVRRMVSDALQQALQRFDALLMPVAPAAAPRLGESLDDPLRMYQSDICTVPASLAGLPALALPCGAEAEGLPVGFQLVGRALDDARLLGIGSLFQKHTGFHRRAPELQEVAR